MATVGDVAWVTLDENMVDRFATGTVAATNLFVRTPAGWKLVLHHGSPVRDATVTEGLSVRCGADGGHARRGGRHAAYVDGP